VRRFASALAAAAMVSVAVSGCTTDGKAVVAPPTTWIPRPLVERELDGLLLTIDQLNAAMGSAALAVTDRATVMADNSATVSPPECLALDGAGEAVVYANSGYQAERDESLNDGDHFTHYVKQAVVMYPVVDSATAFLNASAQQWRACGEFTHTQTGSQWTVGPITYTAGLVSTTVTERDAAAPGWACGRAMSVENNVVIDVNTCSADPADSASKIARQISQNVAARW
jgi:hypothetical protein